MMTPLDVSNGRLDITPDAFTFVTVPDKGYEAGRFFIVFFHQAVTRLRKMQNFVAEAAQRRQFSAIIR